MIRDDEADDTDNPCLLSSINQERYVTIIETPYNKNLNFTLYHTTGLGLVTFSDPPSGSVVANFKGTLNATTLTCNVSNNNSTGHQVTSVWTMKDFRNSSGREVITQVAPDLFHVDSDPDSTKFDNRLTILNFTSELDGETIYCGTDANKEEANFTLRVYRSTGDLNLGPQLHIPNIIDINFTYSYYAKCMLIGKSV